MVFESIWNNHFSYLRTCQYLLPGTCTENTKYYICSKVISYWERAWQKSDKEEKKPIICNLLQ